VAGRTVAVGVPVSLPRPCAGRESSHRTSTSMSCTQTSSGAMMTSTASPFLRGETTFAVRHFAWNGNRLLFFQAVIPAQDLPFRSGIDDSFVVDSVFPNRVLLGFLHRLGPRTRRTEVRPICSRRAISDLLTPSL
jgi:hypothetical protein